MRIIFMGTPEFAIPSLEAIVHAGHDVPLVVSVPDKPKGRGRKLVGSPVKARALELGLEVATPERLSDPAFVELLRSKHPDLICVVAFRILPEQVYSVPRLGSFNLHGSLLPRYRGAAPIQRAIMAGDSQTGVTTFFLKKKVDTGDMILQKVIAISPDMTAGELHDTMMEVGAAAVAETIRTIESGTLQPLPQDDTAATPAPKIFREDCRINWHRPVVEIHNQVRGLSPYPGAFTEWKGEVLKVLRAAETDVPGLLPGEVQADKNRLFVGTATTALEVLELQREGRRGMKTEEFLRGAGIGVGEHFH